MFHRSSTAAPCSSRFFPLAICILAALAACGDEGDPAAAVEVLGGDTDHFGMNYDQWAAQWVEHVSSFSEPECLDPLDDQTGEACAAGQDPDSPVFFLVGTFGGKVSRQCAVPANKALFFPILNTWGDNAGVPQDMLASEEEIRTYVEQTIGDLNSEDMWVRVDGQEIGDLDEGLVLSAPYTVEYEPENNSYSCMGIDNVEGSFEGLVGGYWLMLAPLDAGVHTVAFGVGRGLAPEGGSFELAVEYELTVQ